METNKLNKANDAKRKTQNSQLCETTLKIVAMVKYKMEYHTKNDNEIGTTTTTCCHVYVSIICDSVLSNFHFISNAFSHASPLMHCMFHSSVIFYLSYTSKCFDQLYVTVKQTVENKS